MSDERFCIVCHEVVWFGAFGVSKPHVKTSHEGSRVCIDCVNSLPKQQMVRADRTEWQDTEFCKDYQCPTCSYKTRCGVGHWDPKCYKCKVKCIEV